MKRTLVFAAVGGVALLAFAQADFTGAVAASLKQAQSLSAEVKVIPVSGVGTSVRVEVAKPNKARLDYPDRLIVADGDEIVTFDKREKTFVRVPQTDDELKKLFAGDDLRAWAGFFEPSAYSKLPRPTVTQRGGLKSGAYLLEAKSTLTFMVDPQDNVARKVVIERSGVTTVVEAKVALNPTLAESTFAFKAPEGAKEVKLEDLLADKWYSDLNEAKQVAAKTGRMIFIDFMADWCGPCKLLEAEVFPTPRFKALSKKYVFLKIDVDRQQAVAKQYNIEAMPTQMIVDATGKEVKRVVGYGGPEMFFKEFGS